MPQKELLLVSQQCSAHHGRCQSDRCQVGSRREPPAPRPAPEAYRRQSAPATVSGVSPPASSQPWLLCCARSGAAARSWRQSKASPLPPCRLSTISQRGCLQGDSETGMHRQSTPPASGATQGRPTPKPQRGLLARAGATQPSVNWRWQRPRPGTVPPPHCSPPAADGAWAGRQRALHPPRLVGMQHPDGGQARWEALQRGSGAIAVQLRYPHFTLFTHPAHQGTAGVTGCRDPMFGEGCI